MSYIDSEKSLKILLVHPSADLLLQMKANLDGAGYKTETTHLGEEAVILCRENHFDLVYCYLNMCGMNGFEVCTKIMAACDDTRVILFAVSSKEIHNIGLTLWQPDDRKRLFEESCAIRDLAFYTHKLLHSQLGES